MSTLISFLMISTFSDVTDVALCHNPINESFFSTISNRDLNVGAYWVKLIYHNNSELLKSAWEMSREQKSPQEIVSSFIIPRLSLKIPKKLLEKRRRKFSTKMTVLRCFIFMNNKIKFRRLR